MLRDHLRGSRRQALLRRAAGSPGFFPATGVEKPPAAYNDLAEENRQLRQQLAILVDEIRLLREVLEEVPTEMPPEAAAVPPPSTPAAAPSAPAPAPAPAPATWAPPAPAPASQGSAPIPPFPTAAPAVPAPAPVPPFPTAPVAVPPFPTAPVPAPAPAVASAGGIPPFSTAPAASPAPAPVPPPPAPFASSLPPVAKPKPGKVAAKIISAGHDSGNDAEFYVDDRRVPITGSANRRGLNVVVLDDETGKVLSARTYDIWGFPNDENKRFQADIKALQDGLYVFVALKDSGMENLDSSGLQALRSCGAEIEGRLGVRQSYALIGVKGGEAIMERDGQRMLMLETTLDVSAPAPKAPVPGVAGKTPLSPSFSTFTQEPPPSPIAAAAAQAGKPLPFSAPPMPAPAPAPPMPFQQPSPVASVAPTPPEPVLPPRPDGSGPKIDVDPRGTVTIDKGTTLSHDGKTWEEVLAQLEELEAQIRAKRLAGSEGA